MALASRDVAWDPAEDVARIAAARRGVLLRVHRRRLRWEDLEDCYSQATLELVARSRRAPFLSDEHVANALEQKLLSRIEDRRRAIAGRSPIETAIARSVPVDAPEHTAGELHDRGAGVESQVIARADLRRLRELIADLNRDQQLVLASQVCVDMSVSEFCTRFGWSVEKYRKVAQRARGKLRLLVEEYERGDRCRRLEADLLAMSASVAQGESLVRARTHVANCPACARMVGDIDRAARSVATLLPAPGAIALGGGALKLGAIWPLVRRGVAVLRHPLAETGAGGGAGVAGSGVAGVGVLKVGLAAVCVAGAAGSYAVCAHVGLLPGIGLLHQQPHAARVRHSAGARHGAGKLAILPVGDRHVVIASGPSPNFVVAPLRPIHLSTTAQIRREFGVPPAHAASSFAAGPAATVAAAGQPATAPATRAQVSQTQAEFGFEK